ncbi:nucleotidyltransferase domain-containing protein [Ammonifex thiophilus]|uniref:Nucleotidyltransferase domain-containing protein n=1 Tax=Ammonifex thiophilus TaxID=444093 RepID=A0A3D8P1T6_9THEO|nr:nucleotidyltransferase domain-containing protein [Ammonifex thiophilus]RDV81830.1 nucleotidyltransferase domain-containing protein [Ammonifex thiophilus]
MPVRSLRSPVLRWPDREEVDQAVRRWAREVAQARPEVVCIGYFGSYARGDWGVGSDLDLIIVVKESRLPFERRGVEWDTTQLPVPVDLLVYTEEEWKELLGSGSRFARVLREETVWVHPDTTSNRTPPKLPPGRT